MSKKLVTASGKWDVDIEPGDEIVPVIDANARYAGDENVEHIYVTITDIDSGETYEGKLYSLQQQSEKIRKEMLKRYGMNSWSQRPDGTFTLTESDGSSFQVGEKVL